MPAPRPGAGFQAEVYPYSDPTGAALGLLPRRTGLTCLSEIKRVGGGSVSVPYEDPALKKIPALLDYGNVIKVRHDGRVVGAFVSQGQDIVVASTGEAEEKQWDITGEGLRTWFHHAVVHPARGLKAASPTQRYFSFASEQGSWYKTADWVSPYLVQQHNLDPNTGPFGTAPAYWPDVPSAYWIWGQNNTTASPAPAGENFFRYEFTVAAGQGGEYSLFSAGKDTMRGFLDGEQIVEISEGEWSQTMRSDFTLEPGPHVLAFRVKANGGGTAGLIAALFKAGNASTSTPATLITATGAAGWKVNSYPEMAPGWTVGEILLTLLDEAQDRGVLFPGWLNPTFTAALDSNGEAWDTSLEWSFSVGTEIFDVVEQMEEIGCDLWIDPDTFDLHMVGERGTDRTTQSSPVSLRIGHNLKQAQQRGKADLKNTLIVQTDDGWSSEQDLAGSVTTYGRIEGMLATSLPSDVSKIVAKKVFEQKATPNSSRTYSLISVPRAVPFEDFNVGDWISAPNEKGEPERVRVMSLAIAEDSGTGAAQYAVEFGTIPEDAAERFERWLKALGRGSLSGSVLNTGPVASTQPQTGSPVAPEGPDTRTPSAPTGLEVITDAFIDANGMPQGSITVDWVAPLTATDGTGMDMSGYDLAIRENITGAPWSVVQTVDDGPTTYAPLEVGASIQVKVRAKGVYSTVPGQWSAVQTLTVADDVIPPAVPSEPILTTRLGTISVRWDGESASGSPMPLDFDYIEVGMDTTDVITTADVIDTMRGPGVVIVTGLPVGGVRYFRFRAYDRSGNVSDWSTAASIENVGVQGPDLEANSVTANTIEAGAIQTQHLGFGVRSTNLLRNPGFEETYDEGSPAAGAYTDVPAWTLQNGTWGGATPIGVHIDSDSFQAARGRGMLLLVGNGAGYQGNQAISDPFDVIAGTEYAVFASAWGSTGGGCKVRMAVYWYDAAGAYINASVVDTYTLDTSAVYQALEGMATAPTGAVTGKLYVAHYGTVDTGYAGQAAIRVDDVAVFPLGVGAVEITEAGIRMWDEQGAESINLSSTGAGSNFASFGGGRASISDDGTVSAVNLTVTTDLVYRGEELTEILKRFPKGLLARATVPVAGQPLSAGTVKGMFELIFVAEAGRSYRIVLSGGMVTPAGAGSAGPYMRYTIPATQGGSADKPNLTNGFLGQYSYTEGSGVATTPPNINVMLTCGPTGVRGSDPQEGELTAGVVRVLFAYNAGPGVTFSTTASAGNFVAYVEDVGPSKFWSYLVNNSTASVPDTAGAPVLEYTKEYACTWAQSYLGNNTQYANDGGRLYQGQTPYWAGAGIQRSLAGFSSMTADLAGATVSKIEVWLQFDHWHNNAGGTAYIGLHGSTSEPATWAASVTGAVASSFKKPEGKWVTIPSAYYAGFKSGAYRGIALYVNSTDKAYYGYARGVGSAKMRVTYVK